MQNVNYVIAVTLLDVRVIWRYSADILWYLEENPGTIKSATDAIDKSPISARSSWEIRVQRTKPGKSALFSWHSLAPTTMNKFKFLTHTWENISPWAGQQLWPPVPENLNESQNFIPQFWEGHTCRKKWSSASGGKYFSYETNARKGSWEKSRRGKLSQGQTQKNWEKDYKNKIS